MVGGQDLRPKPRALPNWSEDCPVRVASSSEYVPERTIVWSAVSPEGERREHRTDQCELCLAAEQRDD